MQHTFYFVSFILFAFADMEVYISIYDSIEFAIKVI